MSEEFCNSECAGCDKDCSFTGGATVTLTTDDGKEIESQVLTIFHVDEKGFIALMPLGDNATAEEREVFLFRFVEDSNGPHLDNIESEEEYNLAAAGFDQWVEAQKFEGVFEEAQQ